MPSIGEGGRIAPALDNTGGRVRAQYIYNMLKWPRETVPEAVMPTIRFRPTPKILDLVYAWLSEQKTDSGPSVQYLSPLEVQPHRDFGDLSGTGQALYMANCAHCHGVNGQGDGFNAPYMTPPPANHADKDEWLHAQTTLYSTASMSVHLCSIRITECPGLG